MMKSVMMSGAFVAGVLLTVGVPGCKQQGERTEDTPAASRSEGHSKGVADSGPMGTAPEKPGESEPSTLDGAAHDTSAGSGNELVLTGLTMTVPEFWVRQAVEPGPFAAKAAFRIPNGEPSSAGVVRITHYPNMRGKNDLNIQRWLGQVTQPDGSPSTREDARITTKQNDGVALTVVDLSGNVKLTMRDQPKPDQRMVAAILDHDQGPHFVVVAGGQSLIAEREEEIYDFLRTARAQ